MGIEGTEGLIADFRVYTLLGKQKDSISLYILA